MARGIPTPPDGHYTQDILFASYTDLETIVSAGLAVESKS